MAVYYLLDVGHAAVAELYSVPVENFPQFVACWKRSINEADERMCDVGFDAFVIWWINMALYPRQNSTFCLQHCCFELMLVFTIQYSTSIIQHCAFTNQHPYFKFSVLRLHATFVCVCAIRLHRNPTFLFSVFTHQHPYFKFTFRSFKCDIHAFHCYVDVRCVCCGAECDMLAAQCNILVGH